MELAGSAGGWEDVASDRVGDYTERLRVPGGWLYRVVFHSNLGGKDDQIGVALAFVPKPGF
jgi:hypothetical protein